MKLTDVDVLEAHIARLVQAKADRDQAMFLAAHLGDLKPSGLAEATLISRAGQAQMEMVTATNEFVDWLQGHKVAGLLRKAIQQPTKRSKRRAVQSIKRRTAAN